jgi:hypothetical protein
MQQKYGFAENFELLSAGKATWQSASNRGQEFFLFQQFKLSKEWRCVF